ncbi:nucleotidyltransferase family protein [Bacillus sp. F19]|nr:nucleotidyltransferase family protein [Bacillus sp. F19]
MRLNLAKVPRELKIIFELLKDESVENLVEKGRYLFTKIDWTLFLKLCTHHRVYTMIYPRLKQLPEDMIPSNVIQYLADKYKNNTFKMLFLSAEMEQLSMKLTEEQIRVLFLKGPVIAHDLYGDISLRTSSDLDFLVPFEKLEITEELLESLGYKKDEYIHSVLGDWKWRHHHFTYFHPVKKIKAEVHWRLNPGPGPEPHFDDLWKERRKSNLTFSPIYFLGKEDLFLFLVSHGARHGWSRLRWLSDIQHMMGQDIDWNRIQVLLKKYHFINQGSQALVLASELLNAEVNTDMTHMVENKKSRGLAQEAIFYFERMVNLHTDPVPDDICKYHAKHLFSLMSPKQKLLFLLSCIHPLPEDAETLPLPNRLHFLYFLLRPFLWAWRKTKRETRYLRGQKS